MLSSMRYNVSVKLKKREREGKGERDTEGQRERERLWKMRVDRDCLCMPTLIRKL